jgi:hypothetical protein
LTIINYAPASAGGMAYQALALEFLARMEGSHAARVAPNPPSAASAAGTVVGQET